MSTLLALTLVAGAAEPVRVDVHMGTVEVYARTVGGVTQLLIRQQEGKDARVNHAKFNLAVNHARPVAMRKLGLGSKPWTVRSTRSCRGQLLVQIDVTD